MAIVVPQIVPTATLSVGQVGPTAAARERLPQDPQCVADMTLARLGWHPMVDERHVVGELIGRWPGAGVAGVPPIHGEM